MEENEARLFYKNKITKTLYLLSYIFLGLFGLLYSLVAGIGLIVENGAGASTYLYVCLGFGFGSLLISIIVLCVAFIKPNEGFTITRVNAVFGVKTGLRILNMIAALLLLIGTFAVQIGFDVGNDGWGNFVRVFAIALLVIEATMSLYSIWKLAWRKENPERYAPGLVVEKIEEKASPYVATKKQKQVKAPKEKKEKHHLLGMRKKEEPKEEELEKITLEAKQIEKK